MDLYLAYGLILLGLFLFAAELFLPTGGVLFVLGLAAVVYGVVVTFTPSYGGSTPLGLSTLIAIFIIVPVVGPMLLHYWPRTPLGKRFFLAGQDEDNTLANISVNLELEHLRGRYGRTVSALRPSGISEFDGKRVDTISEGNLIEPGQWVRCIEVRAGRVVVRQVAKPPELDDMDTNDLV